MVLVREHLRHNALRFPEKVSLIDTRSRISYGDLNALANRLARGLAAAGCRRGDLRHPAVREAGVIGLPSDRWGEEVTAVLVLRDGHAAAEPELLAFCRETLAGFKVPKRIVFLRYEEMPINYSGKILKRELRAKLSASAGSTPSVSPTSSG